MSDPTKCELCEASFDDVGNVFSYQGDKLTRAVCRIWAEGMRVADDGKVMPL